MKVIEWKEIVRVAKEEFSESHEKIRQIDKSFDPAVGGHVNATSFMVGTVRDIIEADQGSKSFTLSLVQFRGLNPEWTWFYDLAQIVKRD